AGGAACDGEVDTLDLRPTELHERCPLYIGSKSDVDYVRSRLKS
ncbi:MAG: class 1 fructose-bisphosphatase, partial [Planctomycetota bacterium]